MQNDTKYSSRHGMLLVPTPAAQGSIIPKGEDETKSNTISIDFKRHALADLMDEWCSWERETEEFSTLRRTGAIKINVQTRIIFLN